MRVPWRWVLPVVPLALALYVCVSYYHQARATPYRAFLGHSGERYGCLQLWGSREAYEEFKKAWGWDNYDCWNPPSVIAASLLNLPGYLAGGFVAYFMLDRFDLPMAPIFYGLMFSGSFLFWYTIGDWFERRRKRRNQST